MATGQYR
uniref:Uncharacterized protein n=1 Tax=Macrostomum lignano TaxID=282301 RepID=A0A1Y9ETB7_9PLAT